MNIKAALEREATWGSSWHGACSYEEVAREPNEHRGPEQRRNEMKSRNVALLVAALLGAVLTVPSFADVADRVTAKVPFRFTAGQEDFMPGNYVFVVNDPENPNLLRVESEDGKRKEEFILADTTTVEPKVVQKSEVVFDRYGDQYFLSKVLVVGSDGGLMVPQNEVQKELERKGEHKDTVRVPAMRGD
jgi:hypothetical protein